VELEDAAVAGVGVGHQLTVRRVPAAVPLAAPAEGRRRSIRGHIGRWPDSRRYYRD
jgi:hypothetical protein